jgi:hypothetical protein
MAVGGEKSFGPLQAVIMRHVATNVEEEVVAGSGHWLMEERPEYTVALIRKFIDGPPVAHTVAGGADGDSGEERFTPAKIGSRKGQSGYWKLWHRRCRDRCSQRES